MVDYATRMHQETMKHIDQQIDNKVESICANVEMPDNKTNFYRGYIACLRDMGVFFTKELPKILNKE